VAPKFALGSIQGYHESITYFDYRKNLPGGDRARFAMDQLYHSHTTLFGDVGDTVGALATARAVIIPAPLEYTVCYGKGTANGPAAIIAASTQMELYDEELDAVPAEHGIATLAPLDFTGLSHADALQQIHDAVATVVAHGQLPVTLGGEHSLTAPCVRAIQEAAGFTPLGIVQFDAHSDLRPAFEGSPLSHASAMRRALDVAGVSLLEVGIRSMSEEERADWRAGHINPTILWAFELAAGRADFAAALAALPARVYITIDLDCFDPGIMPAVGTPEPGGLGWYSVLGMIRAIAMTKQVVGCDVVELAPIPDLNAPDFLAAKLVYRMLGAIFASRQGGAA
jgi:agmatinase